MTVSSQVLDYPCCRQQENARCCCLNIQHNTRQSDNLLLDTKNLSSYYLKKQIHTLIESRHSCQYNCHATSSRHCLMSCTKSTALQIFILLFVSLVSSCIIAQSNTSVQFNNDISNTHHSSIKFNRIDNHNNTVHIEKWQIVVPSKEIAHRWHSKGVPRIHKSNNATYYNGKQIININNANVDNKRRRRAKRSTSPLSNNQHHNSNSNSNEPSAPGRGQMCIDCIAIPLVALVGRDKQFNGFIIQTSGTNNNNNNNNVKRPQHTSKITREAYSSGATPNSMSHHQPHYSQSSYNQTSDVVANNERVRPSYHYAPSSLLIPHSDDKCPMSGPLTVCDQINFYPTDVILDKLATAEHALKQSYFNLDSLFTDESEFSSDPFESSSSSSSNSSRASNSSKSGATLSASAGKQAMVSSSTTARNGKHYLRPQARAMMHYTTNGIVVDYTTPKQYSYRDKRQRDDEFNNLQHVRGSGSRSRSSNTNTKLRTGGSLGGTRARVRQNVGTNNLDKETDKPIVQSALFVDPAPNQQQPTNMNTNDELRINDESHSAPIRRRVISSPTTSVNDNDDDFLQLVERQGVRIATAAALGQNHVTLDDGNKLVARAANNVSLSPSSLRANHEHMSELIAEGAAHLRRRRHKKERHLSTTNRRVLTNSAARSSPSLDNFKPPLTNNLLQRDQHKSEHNNNNDDDDDDNVGDQLIGASSKRVAGIKSVNVGRRNVVPLTNVSLAQRQKSAQKLAHNSALLGAENARVVDKQETGFASHLVRRPRRDVIGRQITRQRTNSGQIMSSSSSSFALASSLRLSRRASGSSPEAHSSINKRNLSPLNNNNNNNNDNDNTDRTHDVMRENNFNTDNKFAPQKLSALSHFPQSLPEGYDRSATTEVHTNPKDPHSREMIFARRMDDDDELRIGSFESGATPAVRLASVAPRRSKRQVPIRVDSTQASGARRPIGRTLAVSMSRRQRQMSNEGNNNNDDDDGDDNNNDDGEDSTPARNTQVDPERVGSATSDFQIRPVCRAKSIYISPRAAMNDKKQWKYVVNAPERDPRIKQIIRVDICESPFESCSDQVTLPLGFTSQCKQKYSKKKLLALDAQSGLLEVDSFFIPSCCVCQLIAPTTRQSDDDDDDRVGTSTELPTDAMSGNDVTAPASDSALDGNNE